MQGDRQASSSRPRHSSEWRPTTVNRATTGTAMKIPAIPSLAFQCYDERIATPFEWRFTKDDLAALMRKLDGGRTAPPVAA
jgi:hypothetical protein